MLCMRGHLHLPARLLTFQAVSKDGQGLDIAARAQSKKQDRGC